MTNLCLNGQSAPTMPTARPRSSRTRVVSRATKSPTIALPRTCPKDRNQRARLSGISATTILLDFKLATMPLISAGISRGNAACTVAISISSWLTAQSVLEPSPLASKLRHLLILLRNRVVYHSSSVLLEASTVAPSLIGVDRLDYWKGIAERLSAFERFLQKQV